MKVSWIWSNTSFSAGALTRDAAAGGGEDGADGVTEGCVGACATTLGCAAGWTGGVGLTAVLGAVAVGALAAGADAGVCATCLGAGWATGDGAGCAKLVAGSPSDNCFTITD